MMKVLFFASLRDALGTAEVDVSLAQGTTAEALRAQLIADHPQWQTALSQPALLLAVNQQMADWQTPLNESDEIALFPPVTGG
ncbi:molybdopterin converting factor subunit 1 [Corallincola luteus]|uniref:Molybdopterin synthase sulfur carrier subunit n=2 Tax=Corallincola luteus TaxID=1775177 RepID=A0ABY2AR00_9GAMM|nr:molybdopterin converting factor subunit 1 [Corallincola luteus]